MNFLNNLKANLTNAMQLTTSCTSRNPNDSQLEVCKAYTQINHSKRIKLTLPNANSQSSKQFRLKAKQPNPSPIVNRSIRHVLNESSLDKSICRKNLKYAKVTCRQVCSANAAQELTSRYSKKPRSKQQVNSNITVSL